MAKKSFKLKSGNTTPFKKMGSSPAKQAIGGGPGEAVDHWKKYKAAKARDAAVDKLTTRTDLSKVQFEKKLAKITKTVDPYPKSSMVKGGPAKPDFTKYKHATKTKLAKNISMAQTNLTKQAVKKVAGKVLKGAGLVGTGLLAADVLKTGVKRVAKGIKTGKPQTKLKGKNIKDTFKRVPKKKYI